MEFEGLTDGDDVSGELKVGFLEKAEVEQVDRVHRYWYGHLH